MSLLVLMVHLRFGTHPKYYLNGLSRVTVFAAAFLPVMPHVEAEYRLERSLIILSCVRLDRDILQTFNGVVGLG
jgi:hypothetical protein